MYSVTLLYIFRDVLPFIFAILFLPIYLLDRTSVCLPINPTPRVLANVIPPGMLSQAGSRLGAHAGFAVEEKSAVSRWPLKPIHVLEILLRHVEALYCTRNWDVDGTGDLARRLELARFPNVWKHRSAGLRDMSSDHVKGDEPTMMTLLSGSTACFFTSSKDQILLPGSGSSEENHVRCWTLAIGSNGLAGRSTRRARTAVRVRAWPSTQGVRVRSATGRALLAKMVVIFVYQT